MMLPAAPHYALSDIHWTLMNCSKCCFCLVDEICTINLVNYILYPTAYWRCMPTIHDGETETQLLNVQHERVSTTVGMKIQNNVLFH